MSIMSIMSFWYYVYVLDLTLLKQIRIYFMHILEYIRKDITNGIFSFVKLFGSGPQ